MAIGKPLLVTERQGVARYNPLQPVLAPKTQQLSSNVPVQKIALADYNIGMQNVKSSFAVSDELVNMVEAGVKAKLYIDNTKRDYKRLNLMEEWQQSDMEYNAQFAKARTPEAQQAVLADYDTNLQQRTGNWRKHIGVDVESEKSLSSLRTGSQKQYSAFSTNIENSLHQQTVSLHKNTIKRTAQSLVEDKNSDVISGLQTIKDTTASLVAIGALLPEIAQDSLKTMTDKIVTGRSTLFATDFAQTAIASGQYPTDDVFKTQMEGVMGMKLGERRLKLLKESFTDAFFKEMGERNRQVKAQETFALDITEEGRLKLEAEVNEAIDNKAVSPELKDKLIKRAHAFDYAKRGYGLQIEKKLREAEYGTSYKPFVEYFTIGEGRKVILETIKASGTSYFDLKELRSHLEAMGGKYEGMNESTIREIITHWRGINQSTRKGLFDQTEDVMQVTLMSILRETVTSPDDRPEWLKGETLKKLKVAGPMLTKMADPMHLDWSKTMQYSKAHSKAWNITLADVQAEFDSKQGVFSKDNLNQPADTQRAMLESYVVRLIDKNFSDAVNEELSRLDNEKRTKQEKIATEERRKKTQLKKELPTFAMESIGEGVSPTPPTTTPTSPTKTPKISPHEQLLATQREQKRIRNQQYASTFKAQVSKGELGSAMGTAFTSKVTDIYQSIRDAHEENKLLWANDTNRHRLNERSRHLKDFAIMTKDIKQTFAGGIWEKLATATGQNEPMTMEGFSHDMGLLVGTVGDLLIDGAENHAIEKMPIKDLSVGEGIYKPYLKYTPTQTAKPLPTPPATQPTETSEQEQTMIPQASVTIPPNLVETLQPVIEQVEQLVQPTAVQRAPFMQQYPLTDTDTPPTEPSQPFVADLDTRNPGKDRKRAEAIQAKQQQEREYEASIQNTRQALQAEEKQPSKATDVGMSEQARSQRDEANLAFLESTPGYKKHMLLQKLKNPKPAEHKQASSQPLDLTLPMAKQRDRTIWDRAMHLYESDKEFKEWGTGRAHTWEEGEELDLLVKEIQRRGLNSRQMLGKGLWEPVDTSKFHKGDMFTFLAKNYNASAKLLKSETEEKNFTTNAEASLDNYYSDNLSPEQKTNAEAMLSVLDKARWAFEGDLGYLGMSYEMFTNYMLAVYGAETQFGTDTPVSSRDVVGELQVTRGTFADVTKPKGNLGPKMADAMGYTVQNLRKLAQNDKKLRYSLLNSKEFNYLAGAAIVLNKLQYNPVIQNRANK